MLKIRDHWKPIAIFIAILVVIMIFLALLKIQLERNPGMLVPIRNFAQTHGLPAGILISFIGSIWFIPFPYEIIVVPIMRFYNFPLLALLAISGGATLADMFNFYTGRKLGRTYILKKIEKKTVQKIQNFLTKYGIVTLVFFSFFGPVTSYDIVAFIIGGFSKMEFKIFLPVTFFCRMIHFISALLLADFLLRIAGVAL